MAFGEAFHPYPTFSEQEMFELRGSAKPVLKLKPSGFDGAVANWANDRERIFGDTIIPKFVYVEQPPGKKPHRVAWVYHEVKYPDTDETLCLYHVACDCSGDIERAESPEEQQAVVDDCPGLVPAIAKQAAVVNDTYLIADILQGLAYEPKEPMEEQNTEVQHFVARSIACILDRGYRHPRDWLANVESGWTLTNLMAQVIGVRYVDVDWLVQSLAIQGSIIEEDGHICVTQRQQDTVEIDRRLDALIDAAGLVPSIAKSQRM